MKSDYPRAKATPSQQIDNFNVIVTRWDFPPGGETGWHKHEHDYVVVPLTQGTLTLETRDGVIKSELWPGTSYARGAGVEHNVINSNDFEFSFIEIEIKQQHSKK
ncbi:cupin domain-containing protein [Halomonas sp. JS92-SW72]|uniref:cupin domain-containing protein n=1 Tax=Halomonas sp. JS92-SW72 TaxID=2306583 RepID=UPI000E5AF8CD|nr:cupin domain-containing protein [Halomonas sp. JS92-SW72]AXY44055.1 cupin domain-containing protein [Halomonas sp. JS92-SW72]